MPLAFIFTVLLIQAPALGLRNERSGKAAGTSGPATLRSLFAKWNLRRSDVDDATGVVPIPGLQVSEKSTRSHGNGFQWHDHLKKRWSAQLALLELGPPPFWTPASPTRTNVRHVPPALVGAVPVANSTALWRQYNHISEEVPYSTLGEEMLTFPERRPREFNAMLATCKTWTADLIVQTVERRRGAWKTNFDWSRSLSFAIFGFVYIGLAQWFLYVSVLTWLFPDAMIFANAPLSLKLQDRTGMYDMAGQILIDTFFFSIFIYFPVFYVIKAMFQEKGSLLSRAQTGMLKYRSNIIPDNLAQCALWVPSDVVIFACPMYLRMPMEHLVSFGWTMYMSFTRGATENVLKMPEEKPGREPHPGVVRIERPCY